VIVRGAPTPNQVQRWHRREVVSASSVTHEPAATWSQLLVRVDEPPSVELGSAERLACIATATAGFRDQFYGLADHVVDREHADELTWPRLVTCGAIDPARCTWGERPVRFAGRRWAYPRVDVAGIADAAVRAWVTDRLVPKVVLATQTKVLEVAVDADGSWVPSTPVIAVHAPLEWLSRVGAALLAPPVSAWVASRYTGAALASNAIKLSARQVLDVPLPSNEVEWGRGAAAFAAGDVLGAGRCMTRAYGADDEVFEWWARRLPAARPVAAAAVPQ